MISSHSIFSRKYGLIGVDIGAHSIKLAQVRRQGRRIELCASAVLGRADALSDANWLRTPPASAAVELKSASVASLFRGRLAACTSPIHVNEVRPLDVPVGSEFEQRDFIRQQLSEIHSINPDDIDFDYWSEDSGGLSCEDGNVPVKVLCMGRRWTNQILADHASAGLSCQAIDGTPLALARAVSLIEPRTTNVPVAALDWGRSSATFCIVRNWQPVYVRCLTHHGFQPVGEKLQSVLGIGSDAANRLCRNFGLPVESDDQDIKNATHEPDPVPADVEASDDEIRQVIAEIVNHELAGFVDELRRTISYLKSQKKTLVPRTGFLFGAGATLAHGGQWFSQKMEMPWQVWSFGPKHDGRDATEGDATIPLLGPAVALSCLAWPDISNLRLGGGPPIVFQREAFA